MIPRSFVRAIVALLTLTALLCQGTMVLAGTTGQLAGTATDAVSGAPLVGAKVTAASPSQIATARTDSGGRFTFLSLDPDTYVVSIELSGYEETSVSGVTITADNSRTLNLPVQKALRTIGSVRTRAAGSLVKPGTTSDVYSVDSTAQSKASVAGGGGTQNSAFSALSTVPGVFVAPGQSGYIGAGPSLSIRGGDYDQIGYEIDGVPVNRAFDNYPSGPTSSLGQQELQVYTGGGPASSEAQGLSGFINQVIRTGTYPGFIDGDVAIGGPTFYHKAAIEIGGATANRNFSYYVGIGGYNQDFRYTDQFNGQGVGQLYGAPLIGCATVTPTTPLPPGYNATTVPSCFAPNGSLYGTGVNLYNAYFGSTDAFVLGSNNLFATSEVIDRDNVVNLHFAIPRKNGLKDDIQVLGMVNSLKTNYYDSTNDQGGVAYLDLIGLGQPFYVDGLIYNGPTGTTVPANYASLISNQNFPHSADPTGRAQFSNIPVNLQDDFVNDQAIYKVQLTHPFSQNALFKLYGYTYYSDWLQTGAQSTYSDFLGAVSPDYELSSHTRGLSGTFIDQINAQNLLQLQGSYTTASALRDNNTGFLDAFGGSRANFAYLVDSSNPTSGLCYAAGGGAPLNCTDSGVAKVSLQTAAAGAIPTATGTCGGGPCEYLITGNGQYATYNTVKPIFYAASLTDDFHPTSKITINGGLRMDIFQYQGGSTAGTAARTFFYNAFNQDNCLDAGQNLVPKEPTAACPAGTTPANFQNPLGIVTESYTEFEPRLGGTYTLDPSTVLRASYGRYSQAPNSAFQQYNTLQQNAPATLYTTYGFQRFGFTSPDHTVEPPTSNNYDFSIEHSFPDQLSFKVSPFYRKTQNQIQQFYLNQQTGFVSGLNVGRQTSDGVEFELDKGDFNRDGLSAKLSFTYTNSYINYQTLSNGSSIITPLNTSISTYNAYTSACAPGGADVGKKAFGQLICGSTTTGVVASPCYAPSPDGSTAGVAESCSVAGAIANPYWNAPVQGLLDPNGAYATYDTFPAGIGTSAAAYGAPYVGTLILNYKKGPVAITPVLQMFAGQKYGTPNSTEGINPELCTASFAPTTAGDPRYPYGAVGGAAYDATLCGVTGFSIPDPYTKTFDGIGAFTEPTILQLNLQASFEVSKRLTIVANVTNLINTCFGGTKVGFAVSGACSYGGLVGGGSTGDIGNSYNPGATIQPYTNTPYLPSFGGNANPTSIYVNAQLKL
jgi:hypothetical protein